MNLAEHWLKSVFPAGLADGSYEIVSVTMDGEEIDVTRPGENLRVTVPGPARTMTVEYKDHSWLMDMTCDQIDRLAELGHITKMGEVEE